MEVNLHNSVRMLKGVCKVKLRLPIIWLLLMLVLTSCTGSGGQSLSPKESALFFENDVKNCRIITEQAEVKDGAGESFKTIALLKKGDVVKVLGSIGSWYVVRLDNNQVGCLASTQAEPVVSEEVEPATPVRTEPEAAPTTPQPASTPAAEQLTDQESRMIELVNQERQKNNLPPLKVDQEITSVARIKSQDMIDNNYFSHNSPTYGSPADMLKSFGIKYLKAGENIATNANVERAHEGLMDSAGHRQNILRPDFTHIGIGIKQQGKSYVFTQLFVGR